MNPIFAALAAVAFGLVLVGADASAAPQPSHPAPARKVVPAAKTAVKSTPKPVAKGSARPASTRQAAAPKAPPVRGSARGAASRAAVEKAEPARAAAGKPGSRRNGKLAAEPAAAVKGRKGQPPEAPVTVRGAKGQKIVAAPAAVREPRVRGKARRGDPQVSVPAPVPVAERLPAPRKTTASIGREAFVPTSPPIPRAEAVRQIQGRAAAAAPAPAPAPVPPRASVTFPPPVAAETARASAPRPVVSGQDVPLQATSELPRPAAPRYSQSSVELSGPEAAAAAGAALGASRAAEAARPAAPLPAEPPATVPAPTPVEQPRAGAATPPPAGAVVPSQPRFVRGVARAYAMDGATFYQNGRKIRVQGLDARDPGMTSEHATQRLQKALDAGSVTVEPVEVDSAGHTLAVVRVNGRNVVDAVRASTN